MSDAFFRAIARSAATRYAPVGRFARHWTAGKLEGDPVFRHLLASGLLPRDARILDLGCGQGVLAAMLGAAREAHARGEWPHDWPQPPNPAAMRGIDISRRGVERAARANPEGEFIAGNIADATFANSDAVVILDVLHYLDALSQQQVLERVRDTLAPGGVLLLRIGDAGKGARFAVTRAVDFVVTALRGSIPRTHVKPAAEWRRQLEELGFAVEAQPMSAGTPFANVLLVARHDSQRRE